MAPLICKAIEYLARRARRGPTGYCPSHSRWYWGLKLYLLTAEEGLPVAWCLADPKIGEREAAQELLGPARERGLLRQGTIVMTGKGLTGKGDGALCRRPDRGSRW